MCFSATKCFAPWKLGDRCGSPAATEGVRLHRSANYPMSSLRSGYCIGKPTDRVSSRANASCRNELTKPLLLFTQPRMARANKRMRLTRAASPVRMQGTVKLSRKSGGT